MASLPKQYAWLAREPGPQMILEALRTLGTVEGAGTADNPVILGWAREVGLHNTYSHDAVPWCGLWMAMIAKRSGKPVVAAPLWALSWSDWGNPIKAPELGDILTFRRNGGGHVGLYVGEDAGAYHVIGGNQSDKVCITRIVKSRLYRARRFYRIGPPANVRRVWLAASGALSTNES